MLVLSFCAVVATRLAAEKFSGLMERATAILCLGLWCGLLPVIMDPGNDIAQGSGGLLGAGRVVQNANIYFFSWGAIISSLYITAKLAQEAAGPRSFTETPKKLVHWYFILAASIVIVWAGTNFFQDYDDDADCSNADGDQQETCNRTAYIVGVGSFGILVGLCAVFFSKCGCWPIIVEVVLAFVLLVLYAIGVGVTTFKTGPGVAINNLYFASWFAVFMSAFLMESTWTDFRSKGAEDEEEAAAEEKGEDAEDEDAKDEGEMEKEAEKVEAEAEAAEEGQA